MPIKQHKYRITIVMHDGCHGTAWGLFPDDWDAIDGVLNTFSDARRISARRVS